MLKLIVVTSQIFIVIDGFFVNSLLTFDQWPYKYLLLYSWTFFTEFMNLFSFFVFFHLFWMFELPQSWMLFIRKWRNQNKSLYRPKNAGLRCLVNCLKQNESVYFLSSSRLNKKNEVWKSDFQKLLCPRLPLNRFSKAICQNVHEILEKKISRGQLWASQFHFLILRVSYYCALSKRAPFHS